MLSVFFSSKCSLFHNANLFGSCIIHILYTGCAKIKKKNNSGAKGLICPTSGVCDYVVELPHWWYPGCQLQPATRILL